MPLPSRFNKLFLSLGVSALLLAIVVKFLPGNHLLDRPIRIGVLHSLTGTMAISERPMLDAVQLAIEEINAGGGVLERPIEPVIADGQSDETVFATEAERLLAEERVEALFGCWTSASRKSVQSIVEKHNRLLFYPVQYEGVESSPNIIYTGPTANQQLIPAVTWARRNLGDRFFLVGSDYIFPRVAHAVIRDAARALGAEIVGENYIPLGGSDMRKVVANLQRTRPAVVFNTINGDSNVAFFRALSGADLDSKNLPIISFSIGENELRSFEGASLAGHYAAWNYFQSIQSLENAAFIERFHTRFGADRVISAPMVSIYTAVHLWAQSVQEAGTLETNDVRSMLAINSILTPGGLMSIDPDNQHLWQTMRLGQIRMDGQFKIVWSSEQPVAPVPYPPFRSSQAWEALLDGFHRQWGGRWSAPTPASSGRAR